MAQCLSLVHAGASIARASATDTPEVVAAHPLQGQLATPWSRIAIVRAPKSQRFLRLAISMPIADPRNRCDFRQKTKQ